MLYIKVPNSDVEQPQQDDATLPEGDYTGEPRTFAAWGEEGARRGVVVAFYAIKNGTAETVMGRKSYFITTENPSSINNARIGRSQLARLGVALGVAEQDENENTFIPGETLDDVVAALSLGAQAGTRLGFRVRNRNLLDHGVPRLDETGEPIVLNEIKSVWKPRA